MTTSVRSAILVGFMSLLSALVYADALVNSFEEAAERGDAQERAAVTKDYLTKTLIPYYGRKYAPVLQSCFTTVSKPDGSGFAFVAAIGANGRIVRLYRDHETNIFQCMRETLEKDVFPPPPVSPYYMHIEMKFRGGDAPERDLRQSAPPLVLEPNKYSYTFGVPKGWEYSFEEARQVGVRLVFLPKGGSFDESNSIIYVNEANDLCTINCVGALSQAIAQTIEEAKDNSPMLQVKAVSPIKINAGGEASVRILTGASDPRQAKEALAFIEHNDAIVLVVLTAKNTKTWEQDYGAFQQIVSGHKFFNCNTPSLTTPCRR
jgi:hypothetical protein